MLVDLTLKISPKMVKNAQGNEQKTLVGHLGTHFDVMDKEFPLEYTKRNAIVYDVSHIIDRDIGIEDIDSTLLNQNLFVIFYTGFIDKTEYGTKNYFKNHPQLSNELIKLLINNNISMIGIDCAGIRRGNEHTITDQYCADHHVFVIENLCNLKQVLHHYKTSQCIVNTYPMNYEGITGLPCRIVAEL